jgi:phosphosulfolactate synthase (CoM biosynthesis protein A)
LPNGKSAIEIDHILINDANKHFNEFRKELKRFGFNQLEVREFKSGSVNGLGRTIE